MTMYTKDWASPLFQAIRQHKDLDEFRTLIDVGHNIHIVEHTGSTLLMLAAWCGRSDLIQLLLGLGLDPTYTDGKGYDAMRLARESMIPERFVVMKLLECDRQSKEDKPPLSVATQAMSEEFRERFSGDK